ncbi:MAG: hypothetical protein IJH52_03345, partial [Oscillospiraceae bacterium]|nr:hypothetical protein [Oscillospiraceae bacterium]
MRTIKRSLALLLAAVMLLSTLSISVFAADRNVKHYDNYLCLGDSIAAGYTQERTDCWYMQVNDKAYHSLVADATGARLQQLGWSGTRTEELRWLFDPSFAGDEWVLTQNSMDALQNYTGESDTWNAILEKSTIEDPSAYYGEDFLRNIFTDSLKQADLVTLNIGTNDILTFPFMRARTAMYALMSGENSDSPAANYLGQMEQFLGKDNIPAALSALFQAAKTLGAVKDVVEIIITSMMHGYQRFFVNWRPLIDRMNELNPDMTLVVLNLYNPLAKVKITDSDLTRVAAVGEMLIGSLNQTIAGYARQGGYQIADIKNTEVWDSRAPMMDL